MLQIPSITINLQLTLNDGEACADLLKFLKKNVPTPAQDAGTSEEYDRLWNTYFSENETGKPVRATPPSMGLFTTPAVLVPGYKQTLFRETESDCKVRIIWFSHHVDLSWANLYILKRSVSTCAPSKKEKALRDRIHTLLEESGQAGTRTELIVRQFLNSMEKHGLRPGDAHRIHRGQWEGVQDLKNGRLAPGISDQPCGTVEGVQGD